uniref:Uncharacterized protein n=1 Tax=Cucumis melo TaxID=3656 RepID=A0A9I9EKY7_CUCME
MNKYLNLQQYHKISRGDDGTFPVKDKMLQNRFAVDQTGSGRRRIKDHVCENSPATHWSGDRGERERLMLKRASMRGEGVRTRARVRVI